MWVQPLTEHEVRGRMQVVFLWRASNDFGSQLSTLTGPESYGGLGTTSSTSPHAIFSHMDRFSLQKQNSPNWFERTAKLLKQTFLLRFWKSAAPHSPVVVGDQFLLRHEADHRPDRSVITAVVRVLPSCSTGRRDAFRTPASNPTTSSWSGGGLGLLPTRSQEPPHIYGSNITTRSLCIPCSSTSHSSLKKENSGTPPVCRQLCAALYKQWILDAQRSSSSPTARLFPATSLKRSSTHF